MKKSFRKKSNTLVISSPARLHLGFFGMQNMYGYSYGSMGLAINSYKSSIQISKSQKFDSNLPKKYITPIRTYLNSIKKKDNIKIFLNKKIQNHIGLGSGTQTALCVGKGVSELLNLSLTIEEISRIFKRGIRSGTGIGVFEKGGFVLDSCKKKNHLPKTLLRKKFPNEWKIILLSDSNIKGVFGESEEKFFSNSRDSKKYFSELSDITLRGILPSIIYKDFSNFAKAISGFQKITAHFYEKRQKGLFSSSHISRVIKFLSKSKNLGIGQSSWGPISYIFTESLLSAKEIIKIINTKFRMYNNLTYKITSAKNSGYKIKTI